MEWIPDPEERQRVIAKLHKKPWSGVLIPGGAAVLAKKYGFRQGFDLDDVLSQAVWRYKKRLCVEKIKPFSPQEIEGGEILSIETAVEVGIWKAGNPIDYLSRSERGRIAAAARACRGRARNRGRPMNFAAISLIRTLGAIYKDGTGKNPFITRAPGKGFRGHPYRFVCDVFSLIDEALPIHYIREMGYRGLSSSRKPDKSDSAHDLNKLLISLSKK